MNLVAGENLGAGGNFGVGWDFGAEENFGAPFRQWLPAPEPEVEFGLARDQGEFGSAAKLRCAFFLRRAFPLCLLVACRELHYPWPQKPPLPGHSFRPELACQRSPWDISSSGKTAGRSSEGRP